MAVTVSGMMIFVGSLDLLASYLTKVFSSITNSSEILLGARIRAATSGQFAHALFKEVAISSVSTAIVGVPANPKEEMVGYVFTFSSKTL